MVENSQAILRHSFLCWQLMKNKLGNPDRIYAELGLYKWSFKLCILPKKKKGLECRAHLSALSLEDFGNKEFVCVVRDYWLRWKTRGRKISQALFSREEGKVWEWKCREDISRMNEKKNSCFLSCLFGRRAYFILKFQKQ